MTNTLKYQNNWEADEYYVDGKMVKTLKKVKIGKKSYDVKTERISVSYNDMGNTYHGVSNHFFITEKVFGIDMEFDLNEIVPKVAVIPVDFATHGA